MTYQVLDTIVLDRDIPDHDLRRGDLGAVVEVYEPDGFEVEFVTASGRTAALVTLASADRLRRPLSAAVIRTRVVENGSTLSARF